MGSASEALNTRILTVPAKGVLFPVIRQLRACPTCTRFLLELPPASGPRCWR